MLTLQDVASRKLAGPPHLLFDGIGFDLRVQGLLQRVHETRQRLRDLVRRRGRQLAQQQVARHLHVIVVLRTRRQDAPQQHLASIWWAIVQYSQYGLSRSRQSDVLVCMLLGYVNASVLAPASSKPNLPARWYQEATQHAAMEGERTHRKARCEVLNEGVELDAVRALLQQHVHTLERRLYDMR